MRQHRDKYCYNFDDVYDARKQWYKNMTGRSGRMIKPKEKPIIFSGPSIVIAYIDQATGDSYKPEEICPYSPGARLWVWETWAKRIHSDNRYYYEVAKYKP